MFLCLPEGLPPRLQDPVAGARGCGLSGYSPKTAVAHVFTRCRTSPSTPLLRRTRPTIRRVVLDRHLCRISASSGQCGRAAPAGHRVGPGGPSAGGTACPKAAAHGRPGPGRPLCRRHGYRDLVGFRILRIMWPSRNSWRQFRHDILPFLAILSMCCPVLSSLLLDRCVSPSMGCMVEGNHRNGTPEVCVSVGDSLSGNCGRRCPLVIDGNPPGGPSGRIGGARMRGRSWQDG